MLWSGERKSSSSLANITPKKPLMKGSVGDDLEHLEKDRAIRTDPDDNRRRRTIRLVKKNDSWGFTLQTYGVKNKRSNEIEVMTYVDYVDYNGPAWLAGLQKGDIFLSVNGEAVEGTTHQQLVEKIRTAGEFMRLVVLFEDCCRKVELYEKFIKLKQVLSLKLAELQELKIKENFIMKAGGLKHVEELRLSTRSTRSSISSDWDRFSILGNSVSLTNLPSHIRGKRKILTINNDSTSDISFDNSINDSLSDSECGLYLNPGSVSFNKKCLENTDSVSEYSLPLHSNFQLGGKFLTFSEDDMGSVNSYENIMPSDKQNGKNIDVSSEKSSIISSDTYGEQSFDTSCDHSTEKSVDIIIDSSQDNFCDITDITLEIADISTQGKRFENGVLINEEDALTKL